MIDVERPGGEVETLSFEAFELAIRSEEIGPDDRVRFPPVTGELFVPARSLELFSSIENDPRTRFERTFTLRRIPWATLGFGLLLLMMFLRQLHDSAPPGGFSFIPPPSGIDGTSLLRQGAKFLPHQVEFGEWWRLVVAPLMHVHWWHLVWNLLYILYVGWSVESVVGPSGTLMVVVTTGVASMAASSVATPELSVGASGVCLGLFGTAVSLGWRLGPWLPPRVRVRFGWPMFVWVVYFFVLGALGPGFVDHFCHLGGLLAGVACGLLLPYRTPGDPAWTSGRWARVTGALAIVGAVGIALPTAADLGLLPTAVLSEPIVEEETGVRLRVPRRWKTARAEHGAALWSSRTAAARMTVGGWVEPWRPPTPDEVRQRWYEEQAATYGAVQFERDRPEPTDIGLEAPWFAETADIVSGGRLLRALRVGAIRGTHVVTVEFLGHADRWSDYERLRQNILDGLELVEPASIRRSREAVSGRPVDSPEATYTYAESLARLGRGDEARTVLAALGSVKSPPVKPEYLRLWIRHHLDDATTTEAVLADVRMLLQPSGERAVPLRELVLGAQVLWEWAPGDPATLDALSRLRTRDPELAREVMTEPLSPR